MINPVLEGAAVLGATRLPLCARRSSERLARQRLPVLVQPGTPRDVPPHCWSCLVTTVADSLVALFQAPTVIIKSDGAAELRGPRHRSSPADLAQEWPHGRRELLGVLAVRVVHTRRGGNLDAKALAEPTGDLGKEGKAVLADEHEHRR